MAEFDFAYESVGEESPEDISCTRIASSLNSKLTFASYDEIFPTEIFPQDVHAEEEICDGFFSAVDHSILPCTSPAIDSDTGWISDYESTFPPSVTITSCPDKNVQVYRNMGYPEWEEELKDVFASSWKKERRKVLELMREMFEEHEDVHELIVFFLRYTGGKKGRINTHSLIRVLLQEFLKWKREKAGKLPKNACLTHDHQLSLLSQIMVSTMHSKIINELSAIFELHSLPEEKLVMTVQKQLEMGHLKEAVICALTFGVQHHFKMEQLLLPLLARDKINLIERYIEDDQPLQEKFVKLMDKLSQPETFSSLVSDCFLDCKWVNADDLIKPGSKLTPHHTHKLGLRFISKYGLKLEMFPNMEEKKWSKFLHHILSSHYIYGAIVKANLDDLIESTISGKGWNVQLKLVYELVKFNDVPTAAKWGVRCGLPLERLPSSVQLYLRDHKERPDVVLQVSDGAEEEVHGNRSEVEFLSLSLPLENIIFVDDREKLMRCRAALIKPRAIIGVDSEWTMVMDNQMERLAVMQFAVEEEIFILDMVVLPKVLTPRILTHFFRSIFGSKQTLKLGYSIRSDLSMLVKSLPFLADTVQHRQHVLDLQVLDKKINGLYGSATFSQTNGASQLPSLSPDKTMPSCQTSGASQLPLLSPDKTIPSCPGNYTLKVHPIVSQSISTPIEDLFLPVHPVLVEYREKHEFHCGVELASTCNSTDINGRMCVSSVCGHSGLSGLVKKCLGKQLDKSHQLSDWERRPLHKEKIIYAALDAFCLLDVYDCLMTRALALDPNFTHS